MTPRPPQRGFASAPSPRVGRLIILIAAIFVAPALANDPAVQPNQPVAIETEKPPAPKPPAASPPPTPRVATPEPAAPQESLPLGGSPVPNMAAANGALSTDALPPATSGGGGGGSSWVLQTITALGIVLGLIFLLRLLLQRLTGARPAPMAHSLVEVLARTTIAPRTHLLFLRIQQRIIVAAHSPAGIQAVTELTDADEIASFLARVEAGKAGSISNSFRNLLGRFDGDHTSETQGAGGDENADDPEHHIDRTREQMSGLMARIRNLKDRSRE